ncbi:hypothetical protein NDU88_003038 [Pleurodeles waltl]|uniref:Uncharacterized protein n=1 Tax=Pleurodeles waltl TaxID=8319 RepID=A0AAV7QDP5_PLEWA|nr:hypothetical protein NDU88_003038 [Pleurodeles waltl]
MAAGSCTDPDPMKAGDTNTHRRSWVGPVPAGLGCCLEEPGAHRQPMRRKETPTPQTTGRVVALAQKENSNKTALDLIGSSPPPHQEHTRSGLETSYLPFRLCQTPGCSGGGAGADSIRATIVFGFSSATGRGHCGIGVGTNGDVYNTNR